MRKKTKGLFLFALGALLALYAGFRLFEAGDLLQYTLAAPAPVSEAAEEGEEPVSSNPKLKETCAEWDAAARELGESVQAYAAHAEAYGVSLKADERSATATLRAVGENWFTLYPKFLRYGRLLDPDELRRGARVMLLDEELAIQLFQVSDPIDRAVTLGEVEYRVVGILRHSRVPGEPDACGAYIPLAQAYREPTSYETLVLSASPSPKSGASSAFQAAMKQLEDGGDFYDLGKEARRQTILLRLAAFALGLTLVAAGMRFVTSRAARCFGGYAARLRTEYARDMFGGMARDALLALIGYALLILAGFGLFVFAVSPVYTFPEWVPSVLVEYEDIRSTYENLIAQAAKPVKRYTSAMLWIAHYGNYLRWALLLMLVGIASGRIANISRKR